MRWLIALLFLASPVLAEDKGLRDVKAWLDGCAALVPEDVTRGMAMAMVSDCTRQAIIYCDVGRSEEFRAPCKAQLTQDMEADLLAAQPRVKPPEGLSEQDLMSFGFWLGRAYPETQEACEPRVSEELCGVVKMSFRWGHVHAIARIMGVPFRDLVAPR